MKYKKKYKKIIIISLIILVIFLFIKGYEWCEKEKIYRNF